MALADDLLAQADAELAQEKATRRESQADRLLKEADAELAASKQRQGPLGLFPPSNPGAPGAESARIQGAVRDVRTAESDIGGIKQARRAQVKGLTPKAKAALPQESQAAADALDWGRQLLQDKMALNSDQNPELNQGNPYYLGRPMPELLEGPASAPSWMSTLGKIFDAPYRARGAVLNEVANQGPRNVEIDTQVNERHGMPRSNGAAPGTMAMLTDGMGMDDPALDQASKAEALRLLYAPIEGILDPWLGPGGKENPERLSSINVVRDLVDKNSVEGQAPNKYIQGAADYLKAMGAAAGPALDWLANSATASDLRKPPLFESENARNVRESAIHSAEQSRDKASNFIYGGAPLPPVPDWKSWNGLTPDAAATFAAVEPLVTGVAGLEPLEKGIQAGTMAAKATVGPAVTRAARAIESTAPYQKAYEELAPFVIGPEAAFKSAANVINKTKPLEGELPVAVSPEQAQAASRSYMQIGPKQNQQLRRVGEVANFLQESVPPANFRDFSTALESVGPRADLAYQRLPPAARDAMEQYKALAAEHGFDAKTLFDMSLRDPDTYFGRVLTEDIQKYMADNPKPVPMASSPAEAPHLGGEAKKRTLPERIAKDSGDAAPKTAADVNTYLLNADTDLGKSYRNYFGLPEPGEAASAARPNAGVEPFELNPAKATLQRFAPSAQTNVWGEFSENALKDKFTKVWDKKTPMPKGWADISELKGADVLSKNLLKDVGEGQTVIMPETLLKQLRRDHFDNGRVLDTLRKYTTDPALNAWKWSVTVGAGPAYHFRNYVYSLMKGTEEYGGPAWNKAKIRADEILRGGGGEFGAQVRNALEQAGGLNGMGNPVSETLRDLRRGVGLEKSPIAEKVSGVNRAMGRAVESVQEAGRAAYKGIGDFAESTDSAARLTATLAEYERNGGNLEKAIDYADKFITSTKNKTGLEKLTSRISPFGTWTTREISPLNEAGLPAAVVKGKGSTATKLQHLGEQIGDPEDNVPERYKGGRLLESTGIPLGVKDNTGRRKLMLTQPWGSSNLMANYEPLYMGLMAMGDDRNGASFGDTALSASDKVAKQLMPGASLGLQLATGRSALNKRPLDMLGKAGPWEEYLAKNVPTLAPQVVAVPNDDGSVDYKSSGVGRLVTGMFPYANVIRALQEMDPIEQRRAMGMLIGLTGAWSDPALEHSLKTQKMREKASTISGRVNQVSGFIK